MSQYKTWQQWDTEREQVKEEAPELPQEYHAWFRPFQAAIDTGHVDGGADYGESATNSGDVSE